MQYQSLIQDLSFNKRNKLVRTGSYEALQQFVQELLYLNEWGWTSPGADTKLFVPKGKDIAIKWYAKSQTISVNGDDRADVENRLKSVVSMAKSLSDGKLFHLKFQGTNERPIPRDYIGGS